MSYFAGIDEKERKLIPNETEVQAVIDSFSFKEARNGKKYIEIAFKITDGDFKNRKLWRTYWFDNETQKYDPKGLFYLVKVACATHDIDFNLIKEDINNEQDICSFLDQKHVALQVSVNSYERADGEMAQVNRIAKIYKGVLPAPEPIEIETENEVENELDLSDELPF